MKEKDNKFAGAVTVGTKGQIVIPKEIRNMFNINPGDSLLILADPERGIAIPPKEMFNQISRQIFGEDDQNE